jgi:hypothetical protein
MVPSIARGIAPLPHSLSFSGSPTSSFWIVSRVEIRVSPAAHNRTGPSNRRPFH